MESDVCVHFLVGMNKQELLCFFFYTELHLGVIIVFYVWLHSSADGTDNFFQCTSNHGKNPRIHWRHSSKMTFVHFSKHLSK